MIDLIAYLTPVWPFNKINDDMGQLRSEIVKIFLDQNEMSLGIKKLVFI